MITSDGCRAIGEEKGLDRVVMITYDRPTFDWEEPPPYDDKKTRFRSQHNGPFAALIYMRPSLGIDRL